ncbi:MAG: hypothetical protein ABIH26_13925 [Candidatus Eisenbacteria bacterium]
MPGNRDHQPLFPRLLLLGASVLFSLVLAEGALRLFPSLMSEGARRQLHFAEQSLGRFGPHPTIGYLPLPETLADRAPAARAADSLRAEEIWGPRNRHPWPERADILVLGDSFAYSQTVKTEEAWTTLLDRALPQYRVVTLGLIGAAPQQYLRIYETFGTELAPDVLLIGFFPTNDFQDALLFDRWWRSGREVDYPTFRQARNRPGFKGWAARVVLRSRLLTLLSEFRKSFRDGRLLRGKTIELPSGERIQMVPRSLHNAAARADSSREEHRIVMETFKEIHRIAESRGTRDLVIVFPSKEEVYLPLLGEEAPELGALLVPELTEAGIPSLDLGPVFRERAANGPALFHKVDGHPNARGYALVAETVQSYLAERKEEYGLAAPEDSSAASL